MADVIGAVEREPRTPGHYGGIPPEGKPVRRLADAVEVVQPTGTTAQLDLKALADVALGAQRATHRAPREDPPAPRSRA
ncbi:hypothetical protein [Nonomuraea turcica]|uniref:hypothetical protein n=1 Tax=Nonomuraea sp. G32 TaxID=3067274 RepID=UPI00273C3064|nr:hypothetical protein [Nonomuraea sp. G32]MDP4501139.1 hypothetical protein [Nonomuraea sp. G32]